MKKFDNAVNSYLNDGFHTIESNFLVDCGVKYAVVRKKDTHILIMTNMAVLFEKKIKLVANLDLYVRRKFYEKLFDKKIEEFRLQHYFVRIVARVEYYTLAKAIKRNFETGQCKETVAFILHEHNRNKFDVSISATNPKQCAV